MLMRHSPGDWYGVVTPAGLALLPPEVPLATVEQIWRDLGSGRGLSAVIDGLVGVFGMSLSGLPAFVVISLAESDSARTALRGDVTARLWLRGEDEPVAISGSGVTTWNERAFGRTTRAELSVSSGGAGDLLPIIDGIVSAGRLFVESLGADDEDGAVRVLPRVGASRPEPTPVSPQVFGSAPVPPSAVPLDVVPETEVILAEPTPMSSVRSAPVAASDPTPQPELEPEPSVPVDDGSGAPAPFSNGDAELESVPAAEPAEPLAEASRGAETLAAEEAPNEYDRLLFGETVLSSVEAAAVRADDPEPTTDGSVPAPAAPSHPAPAPGEIPPPPPPLPAGLIGRLPNFGAPPPPPGLGDHDGETVLVEDLQHLLGGGVDSPRPPTAPVSAPTVRTVPKLVIGGRAPLPLDRTAIVGTRPRLSRVQGDNASQLVPVESPNGEISRSHVELRVEGSNVLAVDLNSTNGTILLRAGSEPVRLQPGEPSILVPGDRVDLGDGVVLGFEDLT